MLNSSRRHFLRSGGAVAGAAMLGVSLPQFLAACKDATESRFAGKSFLVLSDGEVIELDAIAACIIPTTDTPGAREAGSIYFMDAMLGGPRSDLIDVVRPGMDDLRKRAQAATRPAERFSELDEQTQIAVLTEIEDTDFFYYVRLLTMGGMFADPSYGGNRDHIGWELIGFDGHFGTQPPFGWYDDPSSSGTERSETGDPQS